MVKIKSKYFRFQRVENGINYSTQKVRVNFNAETKEIVGFDWTVASTKGGAYILLNEHNRYSKKTGVDRWARYLDHMKSANITL